jgi:hypothetical protein
LQGKVSEAVDVVVVARNGVVAIIVLVPAYVDVKLATLVVEAAHS